jgi:hypothetical protein
MAEPVMHMCDCEFCESCGVENPTRPALRDAVIEAARKAAAAWRGNRVGLASMFAAVTDAVDALERAEGEE